MRLETERIDPKWRILLVDCEKKPFEFDSSTDIEYLIEKRLFGRKDVYTANLILVAMDGSDQLKSQFHILKNRFGEAEHYLGFTHARDACKEAIKWTENRAELNSDKDLVKKYKQSI